MMVGASINMYGITGLTDEEEEKLKQAKQYALEETMKFAQSQQVHNQQNQMLALADAAQRQRALLLMSRIYVGSIYYELGEDTLKTAFCPFGTVKSINMSWDAITMKHKGYAFVEFETVDAAQLSLEQMDGALMGGRPIKVGRPNNVPQAAPIFAKMNEEAREYHRVYVASINLDVTEDELKSVFEVFGIVRSVQLAPDVNPTRHRGWGYIEYATQKSCDEAIASMNLFTLGGQYLRVGRALTPPLPLMPPNASLPFIGSLPNTMSMLDFNPLMLQGNGTAPESSLQQEESVSISGSNARLLVMHKLSRRTESRVVVLRNMVGPEDIDEDLEGEVNDECSRYGKVQRVVVYQETQEDESVIVKIFVLFSKPEESQKAADSLDGRYFSGRVVKGELYDEAKFNNNDLSG
ncbi:Poly(U)-binding-splicing factor PUF60 [Oopsacas minuta]|uniref:Poly(U)-binding-splicing factor PUF60 n=1 Tax=Oopsacas minuta TaxID=111878 RepID=A0AAV7JB55_9METZ|nr:Poly(U)-binding-splicing factor PUF60 [Oopsacas minuta]